MDPAIRPIRITELQRLDGTHRWYRAECPDCSWMLEGRNVSPEALQMFADSHSIRGH